MNNRTIPKLIQIFKDESNKDIHKNIIHVFAYLFKSLPLPLGIRKEVIEELKREENDMIFN
jgi:hypothetical protein